ncbi:alpha/beta hydrolase [uncultured Thiohalocapsa sp.]|uniref:alpha/beta fold hydrolase n=1 Tax=uncultured Thiohalocapsa sp. TaxID=768990 RepID=UPI0025D298E5|nr:alpha/beta hydrolase [uncultured Thiohalocapsa sp.]
MPWLIAPLLLLGLLAGITQLEARRLEARHPPVGRFAAVAGVRLHYSIAGPAAADTRPIVLIHGASTSLLDFHASLLPPLAEAHRVVAVDRPGHGYSERGGGEQTGGEHAEGAGLRAASLPLLGAGGGWPDPAEQARLLHELLLGLGIERPVLVGHSLAGAVVLAYLLAYPDDAAGGVLLAGGSHPWEGGVAWYNDLAGVPVLGPLFAHTLPLTLGRLLLADGLADAFAPNAPPPDYLNRTGVALTLRPQTFLANAEDVRRLSPFLERQSAHYAYIRRPLLLVTGDADAVVPAWNHAERLVQQAPLAELVRLPGMGHGLHHVARDQVAALIDNFARRVAREPAPRAARAP